MDNINDEIKHELNNLVSALQKMLPKKKDLIILPQLRTKITRLSNIHAEAKSVFPNCFVGAKLVILRDIMDRVKLVQQYNFGKPKETYRFYKQVLHKELEPQKTDQGLYLDSTGSATATYREELDDGYEIRLMSKIKDLVSSETEVVLERDMPKFVGSVALNMRNVSPSTLCMVSQFMYKLQPELCVGAEVRVQPYYKRNEVSVSARYERPAYTLTSTLGKAGFQVCMFKRFAPDLRVATIINQGSGTPVFGLAVHKSYGESTELRVFVDSQRCGGFTVEKEISFHEAHNDTRTLRILTSAMIDRQRRVRFGFGFNLDF